MATKIKHSALERAITQLGVSAAVRVRGHACTPDNPFRRSASGTCWRD